MDKETIIIASEDVEIIDASEYKEELSEHFGRVPEVAKPLLKGAKTVFSQIEKSLYTAPAFINAVKEAVPDVTLQAMLTDEQKQQITKGALATVYKGNIIKNLIMDCQSYTKYRPNETTGGIFVSWRRKEKIPTGLD